MLNKRIPKFDLIISRMIIFGIIVALIATFL